MLKGFYKQELGKMRPFIEASISIPKLGLFNKKIEFLIDTGADMTLISEKDAMRVGLDFRKLDRAKKDLGGLGGRMQTYTAETIIKIQEVEHKITVSVAKHSLPESADKQELKSFYQRIPSLLGRDVLDQFCILMHKKTNRIYLLEEKEIPRI